MSNLAEILATTVEQHSDQIAVKLDDIELNYAVVEEARRARRRPAARRRGSARATASGSCSPTSPTSRSCSTAPCAWAPWSCR